jgi:hypothetical protein
MPAEQIGHRFSLQHVQQKRGEIDAGGGGQCERSGKTRVHFDN